MTAIASIHDRFIRAILSDKEIARDYFKACLPQNVAGLLDWSTLVQLPDTYISKTLRKTVSDIVYSCRSERTGQESKICLLLEHKSRPDRFTPVQLLGYLSSGFQKQAAQEKALSPIIPVLLYHGRERWPYRTLAGLFKNRDPALERFIPEYEYIYHDLGEIPHEDIENLENKFLQASLISLKYSQFKTELIKWIPTILSLTMETHQSLQSNLIVYIFGICDLQEEEIITTIEDASVNVKNTIMNTLDIFVEKGKREKTEKAVRNMIREGLSTDLICRVQEVSPEYVSRIREEVKQGRTTEV